MARKKELKKENMALTTLRRMAPYGYEVQDGYNTLAGYYGGKVDTVIMRFLDILQAIPAILLAISISAVLGTAFMAGSVFAVTAPAPEIVLSIVLAVPGFLGWILPYFVYRSLVRKRTLRLTPLIEEKYNEIYEICEKGSHLLF